MTKQLDRAIGVALNAVGALKHDTWTPNEGDRTYARALISEVVKEIEAKMRDEPLHAFAEVGARAILREIKLVYGIVEGEG